MLNIVELERRWLRYKIKSYLPHAIITLSVITISLVVLSFLSNDKTVQLTKIAISEKSSIVIDKNKLEVQRPIIQKPLPIIVQPTVEKEQEKQTVVIVPNIIIKPTNTRSQVQLSPSLDFMRKMQNSMQPYYSHENTHVQRAYAPQVEVVKQEQQRVYEELQTDVEDISDIEEVVPVAKKISIKRQNTQNDIFEIIKRFKKNNNPALSLFVAKKYYDLENYQQAYNYALLTNGINEDIESSWIIFSKSLVKLGKKKKAITILKKYIKQSHSNGAKILLDEIRSGKFK